MPRKRKKQAPVVEIREARKAQPKPKPKPIAAPNRKVSVTLDQQEILRVQIQPNEGIVSVLFADGYTDGDGDFQAVRRRRANYKGDATLAEAWAAYEAALWALIDAEPAPFERPVDQGEPFAVAPTE